jgi:hypothetical protein
LELKEKPKDGALRQFSRLCGEFRFQVMKKRGFQVEDVHYEVAAISNTNVLSHVTSGNHQDIVFMRWSRLDVAWNDVRNSHNYEVFQMLKKRQKSLVKALEGISGTEAEE